MQLFEALTQLGARRILRGLVLALPAVLFIAWPVFAQGKKKSKGQGDSKGPTLVNHWRNLAGAVDVQLVFTDLNDKEQDVSLIDAPPELLKALPPRLQVERTLPILQPKVWYFEDLWFANREAICKEVAADVQQALPAGKDNEAYNADGQFNVPLSCRPIKYAWMSAFIDSSAPSYFLKYNSMGAEVIPAGGYPTNKVKQLQIELSTGPVNTVPFAVTTTCTCHSKNATCDQDPRFTMFFEVLFVVRANSTQHDSWQFGPNPQMNIGYYVGQSFLAGKTGYEQQISKLEDDLEKDIATDLALAADGELGWAAVIVQVIDEIFKHGIGGLFAATCEGTLYNTVEASLSGEFKPPTLIQTAKQASDGFKTLFLAVESGGAVGFTKLDIEQGSKHNLVFKLTYPAPDKPKVENAVAASNKGIHLQAPTIATGGGQVEPGVAFPVRGSDFLVQSTNGLKIIWNKTVAGPAIETELQWGPEGGHMDTVKAPGLALGEYLALGLKPNTSYRFRVHECDAISCAPWSELTTSTKQGGSNNVEITLDNDKAHPVGTAVIAPDGAFVVNVTVPAGTSPGTHTLHASPDVSVDIVVAGKGGPEATISVIDSRTRAALPAPVNLMYPSTFTVRGSHFAPGAKVVLHLDSPTGTKLGTATADNDGMFVADFQVSMVPGGGHQLVAVQTGAGKKVQATEKVTLIPQPK